MIVLCNKHNSYEANLRGADLRVVKTARGADLRVDSFRGADLRGANVRGGADIRDSIFIALAAVYHDTVLDN